MFVKIDKKVQIKLVDNAVKKAGSERKLENITHIPDASINRYKKVTSRLPYNRFKQLLSFLKLKETDFKFELIDERTYRVNGGKAVYQKYLKENRFAEIHKKMRQGSSKMMKKWHKTMKQDKPEEYYTLQYSRFKKIAQYKFKTKRGEPVRNKLEQVVANKLFELEVDYAYEPYIKGLKAPYFPDFKIGNLIIECTMWKGVEKAYSLLKKIQDLENTGYTVKVIIPNRLIRFYKPIEKNIISIEELTNLMPR